MGADIQIKMFDNRIVVESPGKLPGMVRSDNIRFTHFSRNPKIAEFLKAYSFVKEYGEGVDRMCKELEAARQRLPEYHTNAFMLKTIVYNNENPAIHMENPAIHMETLNLTDKKPDLSVNKVEEETFKAIVAKGKYFSHTKENFLKVYDSIETNQIFGAPEITEILHCTATVSKDMIKKFKDMGIVVAVRGKGKGKYRFAYQNEMMELLEKNNDRLL